MKNRWIVSAPLLLALVVVGCAPGIPSAATGEESSPTRSAQTLVLVARGELASLAAKQLQGTGGGIDQLLGIYNAALDITDENGAYVAYLADALPQLNTPSWRVFPDGRMETTYRLKANLTWHDGGPLTARDFAFAWRVYLTPEFGTGGVPIGYMEDVRAPDPRTLIIQWRQPYPEAGVLGRVGLPPLPEHILEQPLRELDPQAFAGLRFWTHEYVGAGPYKVVRVEPGSSIESVAFDGHVLGRPKIERMRLVFIGDTNTVIANMLAGEAHFVTKFVLGTEETLTLEREWPARGGGVATYIPNQMRLTQVQLRPEFSKAPLLRDVRVRRALAHGIDNDAALEAITYGKGLTAVVPSPPQDSFWPAIDQAVPRYAFDPRQARQLLDEAGLVRGADGRYFASAGEPFGFEFGFILQANNERENAIFVDSLQRLGVNAVSQPLSSVQLRDPHARVSFSGAFTAGASNLLDHTRDEIPTAEKRWQGKNRGGWENPEFNRLASLFITTLEPAERTRIIVSVARIFSQELPGIPHYLSTSPVAWTSRLANVPSGTGPGIEPLALIHRWEWR